MLYTKNLSRLAIVGLAIVSLTGIAHADTIIANSAVIGPFSADFGSGTGANPTTTLSAPKFDTTLGVLTDIYIVLGGSVSTTFSGTNSSEPNSITLTSSAIFSLFAPSGTASAPVVVYSTQGSLGPIAVASNATFGPIKVGTSGADGNGYTGAFAPFEAAGGGFVSLPVTAHDTSSASGVTNLTASASTTASVYATVIYTYTPGVPVTGKIALEGVNDLAATSPNAPLGTFHLSFRAPGTTTETYGFDVTLGATAGSPNGTYSISVPPATYDVWIKGSKNLAVLNPGVVVSDPSAIVPDTLLPAADADNSNTCDVYDFGILVNAYGSGNGFPFNPNNPYDPAPDFNFDGTVDVYDFGLLVNNYGSNGDK